MRGKPSRPGKPAKMCATPEPYDVIHEQAVVRAYCGLNVYASKLTSAWRRPNRVMKGTHRYISPAVGP